MYRHIVLRNMYLKYQKLAIISSSLEP